MRENLNLETRIRLMTIAGKYYTGVRGDLVTDLEDVLVREDKVEVVQ